MMFPTFCESVYNASMPLRISRRNWVILLGTAPLLAQTPPQSTAPPVTPEQRMDKAKSQVREVSDKLAAIEVPMNIEPAFRFRA
jgi:hypothetical protein